MKTHGISPLLTNPMTGHLASLGAAESWLGMCATVCPYASFHNDGFSQIELAELALRRRHREGNKRVTWC